MTNLRRATLALFVTGAFFVLPRVASADGMPAVVISELMWMGSSMVSSDEWIELRNTTSEAVDLAGWRLTKLSSGVEATMLTISSGSIPGGGLFVVANDPAATSRLASEPDLVDTAVSLVNTKLQITLYDANGALIDRADDGSGAPLAGEYVNGSVWKSMERNLTGIDGTVVESWHTASASVGFDDATKEYGTPGSENSNLPPVIVANIPESAVRGEVVYFDASESSDPEHDPFSIAWAFPDGAGVTGLTAEHRFPVPGTFTIVVTASDGRAESRSEGTIVIEPAPVAITPTSPPPPESESPPLSKTPVTTAPSNSTQPSFIPQTSNDVLLNEALPDPEGRDEEGEFIELVNTGKEPVNLHGWKMADAKTDFRIETDLVLDAGETLAFFRTTTKIVLGNAGDVVFLVDPFGAAVNGVKIDRAQTGKSFARTEKGDWQWAEPTPNAKNQFVQVEEEKEDQSADEEQQQKSSVSKKFQSVPIKRVRTLARRAKVEIAGTVIAEPGMLGSNFFYIADESGGVQISMSRSEFPELSLGDRVVIRGSVGEAEGERRVNVAEAGDIELVTSGDAPELLTFSADLPSGSLTMIEGVVQEKRGSSLTLETLAGSHKVSLARSSGATASGVAVGDTLRVTGIWRVTKDGARLVPRSQEDIESVGEVKGETVQASADLAAKESSSRQPQTVEVPKTQNTALPWVQLAGSFGLLAAAGGVYWWKKKTAPHP